MLGPGIVLGRLHRAIARVLHDLRVAVERHRGGAEVVAVADPSFLAARLHEQLGREPSRSELLVLLTVVEGLENATALLGPHGADALVASYARGLRRQLAD